MFPPSCFSWPVIFKCFAVIFLGCQASLPLPWRQAFCIFWLTGASLLNTVQANVLMGKGEQCPVWAKCCIYHRDFWSEPLHLCPLIQKKWGWCLAFRPDRRGNMAMTEVLTSGQMGLYRIVGFNDPVPNTKTAQFWSCSSDTWGKLFKQWENVN